MKKFLTLALALVMLVALACPAALAEEKSEYNVTVLVWKFDDTYGSSVRQGMLKWAEIIGDELGVMDSTAAAMCRDNHMKMLVFDLSRPDNIYDAVMGANIGTVVSED